MLQRAVCQTSAAQFSRFGLRYQHDRDPTLLGWIGSQESQDAETALVASYPPARAVIGPIVPENWRQEAAH
jgi:hypothetical protein